MFENLSFKRIRQNFFGVRTTHLLTNLVFSELVETMQANSELSRLPEDNYLPSNNAIRFYKDGNVYVVYYDRIRLLIVDDKEKLVTVSLLDPQDQWKVFDVDNKGKTIFTIDSPETEVYTVYTCCNVLMPTGRMMFDERYTKGSWNEYVFNSINYIVEQILRYKKRNKFNNYYNK